MWHRCRYYGGSGCQIYVLCCMAWLVGDCIRLLLFRHLVGQYLEQQENIHLVLMQFLLESTSFSLNHH